MKQSGRIILAVLLAVCIGNTPVYGAATIRGQNTQPAQAAAQEEVQVPAQEQTPEPEVQQAQEEAKPEETKPAAAAQPAQETLQTEKATQPEAPAQSKPAEPEAVVSIRDARYPASYSMGHEVSVGGVITSNVPLERVEIGVVSASTKNWVAGHKLDRKGLSGTEYNIVNAVSSINFWTLPEGNYYYRIYAHTKSGKAVLLVNEAFTVRAATASGTLENLSIPSQYAYGTVPAITGRIVCDVPVKRVEAGLVSVKTKQWVSGCKYDNSRLSTCEFDLSRALSSIAFAKAEPGSYYFRVYAHTRNGKCLVLTNTPVRITGTLTSTAAVKKLTDVMDSQVGTKTGEKYWKYYYGTKFRNGDSTPWCGAFVAWCYDEAGLIDKIEDVEDYGNLGYVPSYTKYANKTGKWVEKAAASAGDIIIFGSGNGQHVGLVRDNDGKNITTIEGNTGTTRNGEVKEKVYSKTNSWIKGIIRVL